jgi:hypothetical protein
MKCKKEYNTYTPSLFVGDTQETSLGVVIITSFTEFLQHRVKCKKRITHIGAFPKLMSCL